MLELVNYDNQDIEQELVCDTATPGLMSCDDKKKLDGIAEGANKYVHPGYTARTSGLYKITVDGNGHVSAVTAVTKADITALGIPAQDTNTVYTHPTSSGNKHIPSGGSSGQILRWSSDGTATWGADTNTVYTHPGTHPASMITQDATHRFVSDTEKNTWNGKVNKSGDTITGNLTINGKMDIKTAGLELHGTKPFIDFHFNSSTADFTSRIIENASGILNINGSTFDMGGRYMWTPDMRAEDATISNNLNVNGTIYPSPKGMWTKASSSSWIDTIKNTTTPFRVTNETSGALTGLANIKTSAGGWSISAYDQDGTFNIGYFSNTTIAAGTNVADKRFKFKSTGDLILGDTESYIWARCICGLSTYNLAGFKFLAGTDWNANVPIDDNVASLGMSINRFTRLYAVSGTINTSDELEKDIIPEGITEEYEELFMKLEPILYKWKNEDRVLKRKDEETGEMISTTVSSNHDRIHCGLGARTTEKHAEEVGLDSMSFAAICKDKLEEPTEDGRTERYGIAYEELHGLEIHMIQKNYKKIEEQENRIIELEKENNTLRNELNDIKALLTKAGIM